MVSNFVAGGVNFSSAYQTLIGNAIQMLINSCYGVAYILTGGTSGDSVGDTSSVAATSISTLTTTINDLVANQVIESMKSLGFAIAALFFLISMIELINSDRLTIELFVKFFARLAVGVAAVAYCDEIYDICTKFGVALTKEMAGIFQSASNDAYSVPDDIGEKINKAHSKVLDGIGTLISVFFSMAPCYIASFVLLILTYVLAFTRLFEMGARGCFLPIAMGMMSDDGWRGAGGRYLKKFLAVCCQSAAMVVISGLATYLMGSLASPIINGLAEGDINFTTLVGNIALMIGVGVAMVSAMMKSIGVVNDLFGA